ncbi:MAG: hypothetical protein A2941_00015 [Candidatus Yanofskybacteria bacterium RIFCSPLOWO2_01_FULL_49_17]|uniref:Four helix bundle protein n=1 Tax=Candidatus Yanofskybacteria bacterium RIFCSPLOWO2_01_FULL_49_17 TaxID=1802700 RepID=A0A1F8GRQ8_9BACT|nr:MAG: hypothetical protein A2941_00015 [Candidatus Yanofskybacteria bacterium RIFCSPLOWO2_01_FULL_49_17]
MDTFAHEVYDLTRAFPKDEIYGITSQLRRASLSVVLNYVEGYSRFKDKVHKNFLEISYGSLQESKYLLDFSHKEKYGNLDKYPVLIKLADDIGAMLWGIIRKI